ncbi:MAG: excinuclease ABC subunit UvrB [Desulfohalobiaceae bacterium]
MSEAFQLESEFEPKGDQPEAINKLEEYIESGERNTVLLGVTGSGKTFTMANLIQRCQRPTLIMAPNKTLAAQLYNEFTQLFPHNAVEYFVSYYDYYQPEAYIPQSDTYIEKDSSMNDNIDKLRHAATHSLLTRRDVIIVASVSCIYGLGSPEYYESMVVPVGVGQQMSPEDLKQRLVEVYYERNDYDFHRGTFRARGDVVEVIPAYRHEHAVRVEFFGDEVESVQEINPLTGEILSSLNRTVIYPASHYVSDKENLKRAMDDIREELQHRLAWFRDNNMLLEAQRLEQRTMLDLEMIEELGYCNGIENYSRHLDGRLPGTPPSCLLDYFPDDFLLFLDESHVSVSQIAGMYNGDQSRKRTLVDYGFRLPSALDNRPLGFNEFLERINQTVYVSATPAEWEKKRSNGLVVEQIIRPTGLVDPEIISRPTSGQMDDLIGECRKRQERGERVLVTTLTKRMAEDLTEYLQNRGVPTKYMHSDIDTLERVSIVQSLRQGEFTVLVGINLLREGLDIPEVALVAILDADKEGFLRSTRSLIQTFGRASRNENGQIIMYADRITGSMKQARDETERRRTIQKEHNHTYNILPQTIQKSWHNPLYQVGEETETKSALEVAEEQEVYSTDPKELAKRIKRLEKEMRQAAQDLEFEKAAQLRDKIADMREVLVKLS